MVAGEEVETGQTTYLRLGDSLCPLPWTWHNHDPGPLRPTVRLLQSPF